MTEPSTKQTYTEFARDAGIAMQVEQIAERPDLDPADRDGWQADATHWRLKLTRAGKDRSKADDFGAKRLTVYFSMGSALRGEPELACVLECLASDARDFGEKASVSACPFEEWAGNLGYDTDSRKAERAYRAVLHNALKLRKFLGEELYARLLWNVEE